MFGASSLKSLSTRHPRRCEQTRPMKQDSRSHVELRDIAPGFWVWRLEHPPWKPGQGWEPAWGSTCVGSRGETLVLDPLAPAEGATEFWQSLDARPPTAVVI